MMSFRSVRLELRGLGSKRLFRMLMSQKESECLLNGLCSFHFKYKGYTFCLSEVLGRGCDVENLKKIEKEIEASEKESISRRKIDVPLFERVIGRLLEADEQGSRETLYCRFSKTPEAKS